MEARFFLFIFLLPRVCTRYEIRSPVFHLPVIKHKFAEHSLRYCLIKQLNREFSVLFSLQVKCIHTLFRVTKRILKIKLLMFIVVIVIFLIAMFAKNFNHVDIFFT